MTRIDHDPAALEARGFRLLASQDAMPGWGALRRAAIAADIRLEDVRSFRVTGGGWRIYADPNAQDGYVDHPMLSCTKEF